MSEIKLLKPEEIKNDLVTFFKNRSLIPIVGAGLSCGLEAEKGVVPNGEEYKAHMVEALSLNELFSEAEKAQFEQENFSTLCDYYEDDENVPAEQRYLYLKHNFYNVQLPEGDIRKRFFEIDWPYVYSLNIDDAIEGASPYNTVLLPNHELREEIFSDHKCLIKLHGDIREIVKYRDAGKIFTSKEYALSLEQNAPLLNKLRNDYAYQNILYIGCSLDDETDLKTLSNLPMEFQAKDNLSKTIIFTKGMPGKLLQSRYKVYGITDVVCFESYEAMYELLLTAWRESKHIEENELSCYKSIALSDLKGTQKAENQNYFFWGKGLYDAKNGVLNYPYFFISRAVTEEIIGNFKKNKVHLVYGARISGKSYLLADIYRTVRDREVYYLDGRARLSNEVLRRLVNSPNVTVLLDIGTLNREQFEEVLLNARTVNRNQSNFVINVNMNDSDTLGIVKWKLKQNIIQSTDIISYSLNNKLSKEGTDNEVERINALLPTVNLPPYAAERTFLDQLIYAEKNLGIKSRYSKQRIKIETSKQLALLIVLAIKEKLYSLDIINFALDQEICEALKKYTPFIERVEVDTFEKDTADLSSVKYVLNSKYWLRRELGDYARREENHERIAQAYQYIIRKVIEVSGNDEHRKRRVCRDYILFDIMNDIFLDEHHGNLKLIVFLYTKLHELLSDDHHFLHQNAKCYLNYAYFLKNAEDKKHYLQEAKELAVISKTMIDQRYKDSGNEQLLISMAHTQYTIATVLCELCKLEGYSDAGEISTTIEAISLALNSPYNSDDYQRERRQRTAKGIISFIRYAGENVEQISISAEDKRKLSELLGSAIFGSGLGGK